VIAPAKSPLTKSALPSSFRREQEELVAIGLHKPVVNENHFGEWIDYFVKGVQILQSQQKIQNSA